MSVEGDDKRTRTRSKGIRGVHWSYLYVVSVYVCERCLLLTHMHAHADVHSRICLKGQIFFSPVVLFINLDFVDC